MPVIIASMNRFADRSPRDGGDASRSAQVPRGRWPALLASLAALTIATLVGAVDDVTFEVERVNGAGWTAEGVVVQLTLPESTAGASATIARVRLGTPSQELRNLRIECPALEISTTIIACRHARLAGNLPTIGAQVLSGNIVFGRQTGSLDVDLSGLRLGPGQIAVSGSMRDSGWNARVNLDRVELEPLLKLARDLKLPLPELSATGLVTMSLVADGSQASVRRARIDAKFAEITANNAEGSLATDKLSFDLQADIEQSASDWLFQAVVKSSSGQAYAQPVFLDLGAHAIDLSARGKWGGDGVLGVEHFSVDHRDVARGQGSATLKFDDEQPLRALTLNLHALQFPGAYESYFQPLLLDTNFKSLKTSGGIAGDIVIENGAPSSVDLKFSAIDVDDGNRTLVLNGVTGDLHWRDPKNLTEADADDDDRVGPAQSADSVLRWAGGTLLNLDLGATELRFNTHGRQVRLLEPARIPILDGALDLESFRIRNAGLPTVAFMVDATIQPISVQQLCKAFGWPEFGGRIGGKISKLRMRERVVTLGTTLQAQVFDGEVKISDLRLEQPFSQWPRFYSSIALDNLDLEPVTSAFSFGRITGRLSGAINGLQLFNWEPVAFDARLYTPPNDRSRHRISQRAVENIGSIGGGGAGVTAALSSGFLRFFDDFNYDRLGVSCRLENEVCHIEGVAPAPNGGYYLVKGKGLPRIDVIGGARRVDWPRLVRQLIALTEAEGPVIQ